jgi:hypothetical protein
MGVSNRLAALFCLAPHSNKQPLLLGIQPYQASLFAQGQNGQ